MKYWKIDVKVNSPFRPTVSLISSTIRGTFGYFLKNQTCIEPSYDCNTCSHTDTCLYYMFYNKNGNVPPPFRVESKLFSDTFDFTMFIFEYHKIHIRPILTALKSMLLTKTISDRKVSFPKADIYLNDKKLFFNKHGHLEKFIEIPHSLSLEKYTTDIIIELKTPLYIKGDGSFKKNITLDEILLSIHRRKRTLEKFSQDISHLDYTLEYKFISEESELKIFKEKTHSNDQNRDIPLLGIIGKLTYHNVDAKTFELLKYGELLGLGNKVAKGQGVIHLIY